MSVFSIIDFLAVCAGALGGAAESAGDDHKEYDIVGVVGLGLVAALGGGVTRDLLLGRGAPLAFVDYRYLLFAFAGAFLGVLFHARIKHIAPLLLTIDAAALGLYSVAGSTRAIDAGLSIIPAIILGAITAAGGGAIRDVIAGRPPKVFQPGRPYVLVALAASAVYLLLRTNAVAAPWATVGGCGTGFVLRMLAVRFDWYTRAVGKSVKVAAPGPRI
ncbi:MAG TPA: TRIC cation channel family protein [Terriglobales bacterium]|nr:TRIC cation channel family protein [Terriglobales bacterium]